MKKLFLLLFAFLSSHIYSQEIVGNTDFNVVDRIAIKNVIDAYGFYWDSNQLEKWMSLFTEDAVDSRFLDKKESVTKIKDNYKMYEGRMKYFIKNKMQRRHMMANTLFLEQTKSSVAIEQYMMLITTNANSKTEIITPIFYKFRLKKIDGIWKINFRQINLDKKLDLPIK
ncbi:nuclear transport factor 2 family protein [Flavobacteriaceae bacterium]|nr:nuclear transport factor 2 family protein [Flavobacteriaceae bacterium]